MEAQGGETRGHCCVWTKDYTAVQFEEGMVEGAIGGAGREEHVITCKKLHRHFQRAGPLSEAAHWQYGCRWFDQWVQNVEAAKQQGVKSFIVYRDSSGGLGKCQQAEVDYLETHNLAIEWRQVQRSKEPLADRAVIY
jgi:hypothetical protein